MTKPDWPRIAETRDILTHLFPLTFMPRRAIKLPLKVGIRLDILSRTAAFSDTDLQAALRDYTLGRKYLETLIVGAARIDLDGRQDGIVTVSEAAFGQHELKIQERHWARIDRKRAERAAALKPVPMPANNGESQLASQ